MQQIQAVIKAAKNLPQKKPDFREGSFEVQTKFLDDKSELRAALCTRRASKTYSCGLDFYEDSESYPDASYLFISLTRESARRIFWKDVLKAINKKFNTGSKFNETRLECTRHNGAVISLMGMDDSEEEKEKALGGKYRKVYIDESASFTQDLEDIVYNILLPAVADYSGSVTLIGTPSNLVGKFFHRVTKGEEKGWSVHQWSYKDNPYTAAKLQKTIDMLVANNPRIVETPRFRQMYYGEWVVDLDKLVYKFNPTRNLISELPKLGKGQEFTYVLGIDLGHSPDPSAFTIAAYSSYDKRLYIIKAWKQKELIVSEVADIVKGLISQYGISKVIVDASAKQVVEEIRRRHSIPLIAAEKHDKHGFINLMNSDFIMGNIVLLNNEDTKDLSEEYSNLIWDVKDSGKKEEHSSCENHCTDSALYMWRYCYNYLARTEPVQKDYYAEETVDKFWEEEERRIKRNAAFRDY